MTINKNIVVKEDNQSKKSSNKAQQLYNKYKKAMDILKDK